jgi:hypothetical protein
LGEKPVALHVSVPHAPDLLGVAQGKNFAAIGVQLQATQMPTALLDAYAGGMLREALGPVLDLSLDTRVAQVQDKPFSADTTLALSAAGGQSTLIFKAQVKDPFNMQAATPDQRRAAGVLPELEAELDVSGAGVLLAFAPAAQRDLLREVCGETIAARIKYVEKVPGSARASISFDAGSVQLGGAADYTDKQLSSVASEPIVLRFGASQALLNQLLADKLPVGASVQLARADDVLSLQIAELAIPLGRYFDADPAFALEELVEHLGAKLEASFPAFSYRHPAAVAGGPQSEIQLRDLVLTARLQPQANATLDLSGAIEAAPSGQLELHVVVENPAGFAVQAPAKFPAPGSRASVNAKLERFPSALLDVLAQQDGLLVDVLGPELGASVSGSYPDSGADPLRADMRSNLGEVQVVTRLQDGVILAHGEEGLDAKLGLTPLFTKRIVGSLLPMLVQVRQDDPQKRALFTGRNLSLPLDADMSKFSGDIVMDLGAVEFQLLPGLDRAFAMVGAKAPTTKNTVLKPVTVRVTNGIARYDQLLIPVAGRELKFNGSADLDKKTFELGCAVPLEILGSGVESQLDALRKVLDPKLEVPLEIYGSWSSPRVRLGKGFLEKTLKGAAGGLLKGELEKGLGGLFGGKKDKKDG